MSSWSIAYHEAAHAVIARHLQINVDLATADEANPYVLTRRYRAGTLARQIDQLERLTLVDMAGVATEEPCDVAGKLDVANATRRCEQIVRLRHGLPADANLTEDQQNEAWLLRERLRARAALLVEDHEQEIIRVSRYLHRKGQLDQQQIDRIIASVRV